MSQADHPPVPPAQQSVEHSLSHSHSHDSHSTAAPAAVTPLDPAGEALADALRISFVVLKVVMICVVALFIIGGIYEVPQNRVAVVLRFGKVLGSGTARVKKPGLHWAFPYPIDEVLMIPGANARQQFDTEAFWYYEDAQAKPGLRPSRPGRQLQFLRDGYSLTGSRSVARFSLGQTPADKSAETTTLRGTTDYGILHSKWRLFYRIVDPIAFVKNLWNGTDAGWQQVNRLLQDVLSDAVVVASGHHDIDGIIWSDQFAMAYREEVQRLTTRRLRNLDVGIEVIALDLTDKVVPRQVENAFNRVTAARSKAKTTATQARAQADEILGQAHADGVIIVAQAQAYRKTVVEAAKSDAERLDDILGKIKQAAAQRTVGKTPAALAQRQAVYHELLDVTVDELYQEALRDVVSAAEEVFVPSTIKGADTQWRIYLSRNPKLGQKKAQHKSNKQ